MSVAVIIWNLEGEIGFFVACDDAASKAWNDTDTGDEDENANQRGIVHFAESFQPTLMHVNDIPAAAKACWRGCKLPAQRDEPRIEASSPRPASKWSCRCRYRVIHKRGVEAALLLVTGVDCSALM
jgi:hypothetical protein